MSHTILGNGDMIALEVDRRGFAACPPQSEPIAEFAETISQLRIAFYRDARAEEEPSQRLLPVDFSTRSAFRIECELPGALVFGSRVRLIHDTSDCKLVASELEDPGVVLADPTLKSKARKKGPKLADHVRSISATHIEDPKLKKFVAEAVTRSGSDGMINGGSRRNSRDIGEAKMRCTYLLPSSKKCKNNEDIWIISSRYKLRSEGESVYSGDAVMFLSAAYNAMPLGYAINTSQYNYVSGSIDIPAVDHVHHSESKQGFIGVISHATKKYSYRMFQLCPSQVRKVRRLAILSGDFVRLIHQERVGELICRVDDGEQLERVIAPLGSAIKKHSRNKDEVYDVYVRTDPSFKGSSGISLWQILKEDRLHFGNLIITDTILLRHAVSGQYLCLKPFNRGGPASLGWYVSTSETPSDNCLFSMHSLDKTDVEQETDLSIGAIRFNQNISFVHAKSNLCLSAHPNPNSSALYKDDYPIEASTIKGSKTEVYKLVKVPPEQVHDALFISRMVPLLRAAITDIQLRPTNHIYLPLFRHLSTTVEVIIRWLGGLAESDFRSPKTLKMTDAHSSKLRFSSSLAVWLGRHAAEFEPLDFNYSPASSRESCESALLATPNRFRQNTVSDICLLDMFFHFANIVYTIGVVRGATSNVIDQKKLTIPVVVNNVCIMIHDLFHVCSLKNSNAALRVLTTKGALQSLVAHECNLWHPPIAVILNAAIESGDVLSIHEVEKSLLELTDFDVRLFVRQMEQLRREGREASHVLGLMDTLSRYGTSKMIKRFQDFIVAESFESVRVPSYGNYVSDEFCRNTSIFFSTRYNTSTGTWEVSLKDTSIELHSAKPEKDTYIHFFLNEVDGLDECFDGYNADSNAVLDMEECFELLEELGLAGSFLLQSVLELQGANRFRLMKWWWENRNLYFSTYSAVLNEVPFEEVREMFIQSAPRRKSLDGNNLNPFKLESLAAAKPSKGVMFGGWSKPSLTTGKDAVKSSNSMNLPVTSTPAPVAHLTAKEKIFDIAEVNDYIGLKLNSRVCNFKVGHAPFQRENGGGKRRFDESGEVTFTHPLLSTGDKEGKSSHLPPWLTVNSLLASSGSEMSWFVRCLQLFCQLCFGKNLGSQAVINKLLPIDCLLHALQNNSSPRDKGLICQLISSLFVHHDFVFPSAALTEAQAKYCSINERDNAASTVTMGRLFNKYCLYQVREEPLNLRISLKEFVLKEIRTLSLADKSDQADDIAAYLFSLLSLLKGLLSIGFFEENFALNGKADDLGADIKFGEDYLGELLLSKLKELYADLHDIGSLKLGIQHTLEVQLKNGDISEEDQLSLIQRISKVNSGNLGAELASTVNRYFSVRFSHQITIDVVDSLMDLMVILMEIRGMNALKNILSALCHFDRVFPDIAKSTDLSCVDTDAVIPKFEKHFIKRNYPDDTARDIDEVETLFNAFYFDRKSLRKKILSFMQQRMFRSDLAKSTENIHFVASAEDSLGRRLFDTIGTTILKYSVEFEAFEHVPTKVAHIKETLSGLFDLLRDVLTNRHRDTIELTATSYSFLKSLKRFSTKQDVVYSPLEFEESDYFLLEYYDFFPSQVCDNAYYLKDLCIQLLRTIARLCRDDDEHDFLMDGSTEEERTCNAPLRKHGALPETSLYFIEMIFDLLAMVAGTDSRKLAIAWLPFAKVVQHFFGVFESVYIVLEVIYQFHPSLAALVNTDDLRFIRSALDKCVEAPATWPAILLRAILLNENDDPICDLVRASVEDYFVSDSSETILRLAASSTQHPPLLLKAHAQILQLLIAVCKGSCSVTLKDRISTLFSIDYCIDFFDCRGFFLVSKSLLLQLLCARRIPLDERLLLSIQNILSKIYRFTEFCERESAQLLNDRWKNSFYDFSLVAVTGYIKTYLETFTRDFEYRISAMTATAHIPRSSLQMISDKITSILTYEASPLHHLPSPPSMKVYHTLGLIIDITMAGNGFLWKTLEADNAALQHMIWIGVTARYLISHSELPVEDRPLKAKIDAFLSHASGAHGIILLRNFRSKFLSNWGIRKYLNAVNIYLLARRTGTKNISKVNLTNNYDELRKSSLYAYELSEKTIRNSAPYAFFHKSFASIGKFVSMGGLPPEDEETGERDVSQRSINSSRLDSVSDFDLWCACGGGLFELVAEYLIKYNFEEEASSDCDGSGAFGMPEMLFNTFCVLLTVRSSPNEKLSSSARNRLYAVQDAFDSFGLRVMVVKLLNKALLYSYESSYFSLLPAILRLGSLIMAEGNRACQNSFMKTIQGKTIGFVAPLRHILRECLQVYAHLQKDAPKAVDMRMLKIVNEVTGFVRNFCGGHNKEARVFLRSQPVLQSKVDLVFDLAEMIGLLGDILLHNYIRYIKYDFFREKLAPFVWNESSEARRQCIAWHDKSVDYLEVAQLLYSLGGFFRCLKDVVQGPCYENQQPLIKLSSLVLPLVEFCGVMHLRTKTKLPSKGFSENSFRLLRFEMSDPTKFLKVYRDELMRNGKLKEEPVWRHMSESQRAHEGSIGLDINLLLRVSKEAEVQCLQFALALLEGTSAGAVNELSSNVNYEILFQNMSSDFRSSSHSHLLHRRNGWREYSALRREASVCYLSLISTLFSATGHDTGMLARWIDKSKRKGIDINAFNASVEIVGSQGDIQQIYFTIPKHISQYWSYPEVQRSKEAIVYQNNRESPEEKINDFRDNIEVMLRVMARQRFLAYLLTPPLHALFGGKAFVPAWVLLIIPRPRVVILSIAIFLNFYYAYLTYRQVNPNFPGFDTYFQYLYDALNYELSVPTNFISFGIFTPLYVIKWLLFGLVGSVFIRNVLNSTAADRLLAADDDDNDYEDDKKRKSGVGLMIGKYLYISTFGFCLIILSEWWSISMCAFSLLAIFTSQWFYVPILLEVVPQFALMRFLVEAVRRNVFKILFTVIMFIILMYFFATINYLAFQNQYSFNGQKDCDDLVSCFITHVNYGLNSFPLWDGSQYIKPVLGGKLSPSNNDFGLLVGVIIGTAYSLFYTILVNLVLPALISGVIIDTFSSMRQEEERINADIRGSCFICSIPRDDFESNGVDYLKHIRLEHNMWKYVWLKEYLLEKDPLLFSGPEHFAFQQMQDKQAFLKLFPMKRSLSLDREQARAKQGSATALDLPAIFELIQTLDVAQNEFRKSLADMRRVQFNQVDSSEILQSRVTKLQHQNHETLDMLRQLVHTHPNAEVASPAHANFAPKKEEGSVSSGGGRKEGESVLKSGDDDFFDV